MTFPHSKTSIEWKKKKKSGKKKINKTTKHIKLVSCDPKNQKSLTQKQHKRSMPQQTPEEAMYTNDN